MLFFAMYLILQVICVSIDMLEHVILVTNTLRKNKKCITMITYSNNFLIV